MTVRGRAPATSFTKQSNSTIDELVTRPELLALHTLAVRQRPDMQLTQEWLRRRTGWTKEKVHRACAELERLGYCKRVRSNDRRGRIVHDIVFFRKKQLPKVGNTVDGEDLPSVVSPSTGQPVPGNPATLEDSKIRLRTKNVESTFGTVAGFAATGVEQTESEETPVGYDLFDGMEDVTSSAVGDDIPVQRKETKKDDHRLTVPVAKWNAEHLTAEFASRAQFAYPCHPRRVAFGGMLKAVRYLKRECNMPNETFVKMMDLFFADVRLCGTEGTDVWHRFIKQVNKLYPLAVESMRMTDPTTYAAQPGLADRRFAELVAMATKDDG